MQGFAVSDWSTVCRISRSCNLCQSPNLSVFEAISNFVSVTSFCSLTGSRSSCAKSYFEKKRAKSSFAIMRWGILRIEPFLFLGSSPRLSQYGLFLQTFACFCTIDHTQSYKGRMHILPMAFTSCHDPRGSNLLPPDERAGTLTTQLCRYVVRQEQRNGAAFLWPGGTRTFQPGQKRFSKHFPFIQFFSLFCVCIYSIYVSTHRFVQNI